MDATCTIQDSIHVFNLVHKYVSRILGTYQIWKVLSMRKNETGSSSRTLSYNVEKVKSMLKKQPTLPDRL